VLASTPLKTGARKGQIGVLVVLLGLMAIFWSTRPATASVERKLDETRNKISKANQKKGVLSGEIAGLSKRIRRYETQVAALRAEERAVEARLAAKQAELDRAEDELEKAEDELEQLVRKLNRSLAILSDRLVAIYESGKVDLTDLILESQSYGDLVERSEYFAQIQTQDEEIVARVRGLRDRQRELVARLTRVKQRIEGVRDQIAREEKNLEVARQAVESQQGRLVSARGKRRSAVAVINRQVGSLEKIEADLQAKVQQQVAAASGVSTLPPGPMTAPSAAGLIWPLSGPVTSGFGMRWGRMHEGIDVGVPTGTPIRAAKGGTVIMASYNGGYGNFTCVDHGGGLSTCYAHQASFAASTGQRVSQGQVIGYSGNTGSSTGPHLHFEVRINGVAQDPMRYL